MQHFDIDQLRLDTSPRRRIRERIFREWCFLIAVVRHRGASLLVLLAALVIGSEWLWPAGSEGRPAHFDRIYNAWLLVIGESPSEPLPIAWPGRVLLFLLPILGLTVIVEAIIEVSSMVRDRRSHERAWCSIMTKSMNDHVVLVGLGKLGFRTFRLLRRLGHSVAVIEQGESSPFLIHVREDGSPLFIGDARRDELLVDAGVARARSIVLATSDDMVNLEAALDARRMNPGIRVVLRMFDQRLADKVREGFNIRTAMSQSSISAPAFATAAVEPAVVGSVVLDDELIVMVRWLVRDTPAIAGSTVGSLLSDHGVAVVELTPPGGTRRLFPPPETRLARDDEVVLQGAFDSVMRLKPP